MKITKIISVLLCIILVFALASCGKGKSEKDTTDTSAVTENAESKEADTNADGGKDAAEAGSEADESEADEKADEAGEKAGEKKSGGMTNGGANTEDFGGDNNENKSGSQSGNNNNGSQPQNGNSGETTKADDTTAVHDPKKPEDTQFNDYAPDTDDGYSDGITFPDIEI